MTADEIKRRLSLEPLLPEGGYFRETYRCDEGADRACLPARYGGPRAFSTAIYFLLTDDTRSRLHRLSSDEIFHFLLSSPVTMLQLHPDGRAETITLGVDLTAGQQPQVVVPRGTWQGGLLVKGGDWALMGVTVAPGFDYADYEDGDGEALARQFPDAAGMIGKLT